MSLSPRFEFSETPAIDMTEQQLSARDELRRKIDSGELQMEEVDCDCGREGGYVVAERDRYGLPVRTLLCENCGLLRSSPRFDRESNQNFYTSLYRELYTGDHDRQGLYERQKKFGASLLSLVRPILPASGKVFEVGCGPGGNLVAFKNAGYEVSGVDFGEEYLEAGRADGLDLLDGDAEHLHQARGEADLVILHHVLEHFLDLKDELSKIRRLVRPGGFLFVAVPGVLNIHESYYGNLMFYLQNAHVYHFTSKTLRFVLERAGFSILNADDSAAAVAQRPMSEEKQGSPFEVNPPQEEARRILYYLVDLEKKMYQAAAS